MKRGSLDDWRDFENRSEVIFSFIWQFDEGYWVAGGEKVIMIFGLFLNHHRERVFWLYQSMAPSRAQFFRSEMAPSKLLVVSLKKWQMTWLHSKKILSHFVLVFHNSKPRRIDISRDPRHQGFVKYFWWNIFLLPAVDDCVLPSSS